MDSASRRIIEHAPLVLADFDGTIATLRTDWNGLKARLKELCESNSWPWDPARGLDGNLRAIRAGFGEHAFERLCREVTRAEIAGFDPDSISRDLVQMLIDRQSDPVAIVTNNTRSAVQSILKHSAFRGLRPRIIGKEDVSESKPSPAGLLRACRLFVSSPRATVFVGDSPTDEQAAHRAGIGIFLRVDPPSAGYLRLAA